VHLRLTLCYKIALIGYFETVGRLTRVPRVQEVGSSNPGPAKSYTALQTVRHRFKIYASCLGAMTRRWTP